MDFTDIKGMIFDMDGTLLDSMHVWDKVDLDFLSKRSIKMPFDYQRSVMALSFNEAAVYTKERFGLPDTVDEILAEWHGMVADEYTHKLRLKPGAREFVKQQHDSGARLALATGSGPELYISALKNNGIYDYFDAFVTLADVKRGKRYPDIYLLAAERLGLDPSECLVFEDLLDGVLSAKAGGIKVIGVYDSFSADVCENIKQEADGFILNFTELLSVNK